MARFALPRPYYRDANDRANWQYLAAWLAGQGRKHDSELSSIGSVVTYTPQLTALNGNPTRHLAPDALVRGGYTLAGNLCTVWVYIRFGSTGLQGSGPYIISLPQPADTSLLVTSTAVGGGSIIGSGAVRDAGATGNNITVGVQLRTADSVSLVKQAGGFFQNGDPINLTTDDVPINFVATYPIA